MIEPATTARFQRELRAMIRAAGDDPEAFAVVDGLLRHAFTDMNTAAHALVSQGFSWREIGRALEITRTAAHKRYAAGEAKG